MIERLTVKNYKSLENVALDLRPLNVFVGPNNAGKSNILDCLEFLYDFVIGGAGAVEGRGGFQLLVWGGDLKRTIAIEIEGWIYPNLRPKSYKYTLEVAGGPTHFNIIKEIFIIKLDKEERKILEFPSVTGVDGRIRNEDGVDIGSFTVRNEPSLRYWKDPSRFPNLSFLLGEMNSWAFYNLVPSRMRMPIQVRKDLRLQGEGENLSLVLHSLHSEHTSNFKQIEEMLRTAVPELKELLTALTEQGQTYVNIEESGFSQRIPAWAMSDGTLRLLAHLAVLYSPSPPPLVCFEEPENYIHPHLLKLIAELLEGASKRTQILVTTHSPYLLDFFEPEDLVIVEKKEGKTQTKRVADQAGVKEALKTLGLGELWYSGSLGGTPFEEHS